MGWYVLSKGDPTVRIRVCAANAVAVSLEIPVRGTFVYKVISRTLFEALYIEEGVLGVDRDGGSVHDNQEDTE